MSLDKYAVLASQEAATTGDLSKAQEFSSGNKVVPAGDYYGYLMHYVDIGEQPDEFQGKLKGYVPNFKIGLALFDFNQESGEFELAKIHYDNFGIPVKLAPKAKYMKIMNSFKTAKDTGVKHFAQFFGKPKLFSVGVSNCGKYNNVDLTTVKDGVNPMTKQPIVLPSVPEDRMCMFLWNNPIVGEFNKLNDRTKEQILNAHNYNGSAVELMLRQAGSEVELPKASEDAVEEQVVVEEAPKPTKRAMPTMPISPDEFDEDVPFDM